MIDAHQVANAALATIFAALMLIIGQLYLEYRADKSPQRLPCKLLHCPYDNLGSLVLKETTSLAPVRQSPVGKPR
jgi:hypothetical protein